MLGFVSPKPVLVRKNGSTKGQFSHLYFIAIKNNQNLYCCTTNILFQGPLSLMFLAYDFIQEVGKWWRDEIDGKTCALNLIDKGVNSATAFAGGELGAGACGFVGGALLGSTGVAG